MKKRSPEKGDGPSRWRGDCGPDVAGLVLIALASLLCGALPGLLLGLAMSRAS